MSDARCDLQTPQKVFWQEPEPEPEASAADEDMVIPNDSNRGHEQSSLSPNLQAVYCHSLVVHA